jgi:hypothetical protein
MKRNTALWLVIGLIVIIVLWVALASMNKDDRNIELNDVDTNINDDNTGEVTGTVVGQNALNVNEQPAGNRARASFVTLESSGFLVIHELNGNGAPGKVVGVSSLLAAGRNDNVAVNLSSNLRDGEDYVAMLHLDNGDGQFSETADVVAKDANGNPISMIFSADADVKADTSVTL